MDSERWSRLSPLLDELLELSAVARSIRLAEIERDDPVLAIELRDMISLDEENPDFLSEPILDTSTFSPQPEQLIGPYRLISLLGEGGMGQVWLALRADGLFERRVALKLLRPGLGDARLRTRFSRERQILARLAHAHIARLLDAGISQDGQPYLALEYVQGEPITSYAVRHGLYLNERLQLFDQVCAAVSHAHANLVVHRDLKPTNIMVTPAGDVCLLDFGIAKLLDLQPEESGELTQTGARAFTLHYASPEQLRNGVITTMTDVYALGVVLYELLTGRKPYELTRASDAAWEEAIVSGEPVRPSLSALRHAKETGRPNPRRIARQISGDLDTIVLKALNKQPEDRYASADALAHDLRLFRDGRPVLARPQSLGYRLGKYLHRHAVAIGVGILISGVLAVALAFVSWQAQRALEAATRAEAMQDFVAALFENTGSASDERGLDVRALLDAGVRRADNELTAQPQARAELFGLIARLRSGLGDHTTVIDLLDRQQDVLQSAGMAMPERMRVAASALRGLSLLELEQPQQCLRTMAKRLPDAQRLAESYPLDAAEFLSQMARCHRKLGGRSVARDLFGQALGLRRSRDGAGPLEAESQTDLALVLADEGKHVEAMSALRDALSRLRASAGERNALGVAIWRAIGQQYRHLGNAIEAEAAYRQSLEIALGRYGVRHDKTADVQSALAEVLVDAGKLDEAERLQRLAHEHTLGSDMANSLLRQSWLLLARIAYARDQLADARAAYAQAIAVDEMAPAQIHCELAEVELSAGSFSATRQQARICLMRAGATDMQARAEVMLGNIALRERDPAQAAVHADAARQQLIDSGGNDAALATELALLQSQRLLLIGERDPTRARLKALIDQPSGPDAMDAWQRWRARSMLVAADCRSKSIGTAAAGAAAKALVTELRNNAPEQRRWQREVRSQLVACGIVSSP